MNYVMKIDNWLRTNPLILLTIVATAVYYLIKSYTAYGFSVCKEEVFFIFLFYEFTSLKSKLQEMKQIHCAYYLYTRIQRDKQFGELSDEELAKYMAGHNSK